MSINEAKQILQSRGKVYSNEEVTIIVDLLCALAELDIQIFNTYLKK
ncbi:MAG TPA: hypothetical protein VNW06_02120 [Cytophagaceae bacterium]|jgi:hypothetical protein|nr:hypothetical protein [Cytophagaceae bacterium]